MIINAGTAAHSAKQPPAADERTMDGRPDERSEVLTLGQLVPLPDGRITAQTFPGVICHDPILLPHLEKPWLKAWISRELGLTPPRKQTPEGSAATATNAATVMKTDLALSCLTVGTPGTGKSRLAELLQGQLLEQGQSLLVIDPKLDTLRQVATQAQVAGLSPEQVTIISPRLSEGAVGWNPFLSHLPAAENATDFFSLINGHSPSWGIRLGDILMNIAYIVAAHRLSVYEVMQCLRRPEYLEALLARPLAERPTAEYLEAADALTYEFLAGNKSTHAESVKSVTNKFRVTLSNEYLRSLLTARVNTLDLSRLWKRQGVVLVHVDRASLGEEGAKFLAGAIVSNLFRTSLRAEGPVPVTLGLDEVSTTESLVGDMLEKIATFSRSAHLSLLVAAQNLQQMSGPLREALLSAHVQISFRLSPGDARLVGPFLAAGTEPSVVRVRAEGAPPTRRGVPAPRSIWRHTLRDASGHPLRIGRAAWEQLQAEELLCLPRSRSKGDDPFGAISRLAARRAIARLYVRAADTGEPVEIHRYVAGINSAWYWIDGPQPLSLVVSFPTPRLSGAERRGEADAARAWIRALQGLPQQHAVLRIGGGEPVLVRVGDVPDVSSSQVEPYLAAAMRANGQTVEEVEACARERQEMVQRLMHGEGGPVTGNQHSSAPASKPPPAQIFQTQTSRQQTQTSRRTRTKADLMGTDDPRTDTGESDEKEANKRGLDAGRHDASTPRSRNDPLSFGNGFAEDGSLD